MKNINDVAVVIQARLGSQRVPQKMIRPIAGTTLTDMAIETIFDTSVIKHLSMEDENNIYGARPIKRKIQTQIENELSKLIISDDIIKGGSYNISIVNGKLIHSLNQKQIQSNPSS